MFTMPMGGLELLIILIIILLFFGARRVPELARSLGTGARELKKAASEGAEESETKGETKDASAKNAGEEARMKVAPEDASPERDGDRAAREPRA